MNQFFKKLKIGCLNDHFDILGGGTVHSFKFIEYLKKFYNIDVYVSGTPKTKEWMQRFLHLDTEGINIYPYTKGCGNKYDYMFLNISHWRAEETKALKKYMLVFFPQFYFPLYDYEFLANSKYTKDNIIKRWKQTPERIHVVYPPIMTSQFIPSDNKEKNIIHVSRITPPVPEADKGHRQMIQAFKEMVDAGLKDWTFHIIGQVQDQIYFGELYRIAHGYPIKFHVDIPFEKLKASWFYVPAGKLAKDIVNYAFENKIKIALNPGNSQLKSPDLPDIIKKADILILNQEEASVLTGIPYKDEGAIFEKLDDMCPGITIMTKGAEGAVASDGKEIFRINSPEVKIVESTGAGDAFGSGFVSGFIKSKGDIREGINLGIANSVSCIQKIGAKNGLIST